jgi:hypothetical protein
MTLQTEFDFTLPRGYVDDDGTVHREGSMRLATAGDEILPLKDPRVQSNPAYLTCILLSRVVTRLGSLSDVSPHHVENLFVEDLAHLQDLYERVNTRGADTVDATCPECGESFEAPVRSPFERPGATGSDGRGGDAAVGTDGGMDATGRTGPGADDPAATGGGVGGNGDAAGDGR